MNLTIRSITDDDLDYVTDMWDRHVSEVGGAAFDPETRMHIFGGLCRCLPALTSVCFVADVDGVTAGFVVGAVTKDAKDGSQLGDIEELYVKPNFRRMKVATALVHAITDWMREKGASTVRAQSALESTPTRAFWSTVGITSNSTALSDFTQPPDDDAR